MYKNGNITTTVKTNIEENNIEIFNKNGATESINEKPSWWLRISNPETWFNKHNYYVLEAYLISQSKSK